MYSDWVSQLNWVDILFLVVMIRAFYIGLKRKLIVEFFKMLGVLSAIFIVLHYHNRLAGIISGSSALPFDVAIIVSYIFLIVVSMLSFRLILSGVLLLFKIEPKGFLDRWGAGMFSILRGVLLCSIIGVFFIVSSINYLEFSVRQSFSGSRLTALAPMIYRFSYVHIVSKFFPEEPLNHSVFDIIEKGEPSGEGL